MVGLGKCKGRTGGKYYRKNISRIKIQVSQVEVSEAECLRWLNALWLSPPWASGFCLDPLPWEPLGLFSLWLLLAATRSTWWERAAGLLFARCWGWNDPALRSPFWEKLRNILWDELTDTNC